MGADIYLKSISDAARAKWEPRFNAACAARDIFAQENPNSGNSRAYKKLQEAVGEAYDAMYPDDGYYRDSYNASSLFGVLGLSWWQAADVNGGSKHSPVGKLINKQRRMSVTSMKRLKKYLEEIDLEARVKAWAAEKSKPPKGRAWDKINFHEKGNSVKEWHQMFANKRENLIALLDKAIARKEPLYCSV
jgi:hypothetical protein